MFRALRDASRLRMLTLPRRRRALRDRVAGIGGREADERSARTLHTVRVGEDQSGWSAACAQRALGSFTPPSTPVPQGRSTAATASTQHPWAAPRGKIPIEPAAPSLPTDRDFVPWRFSDAGRRSAWLDRRCRRPKTCTIPDSCTAANSTVIRSPRRRAQAASAEFRGRVFWQSRG
jgi:hypothetical protein